MPSESGGLAPPDSTTIAALSERDLIARIQAHLPPAPSWMLVGIGDDAAVVEPERNRVEVLSVDAIVEGIHFDRAFVPPGAIGHRALAVNLSDLAAMGAAPRLALVSMVLPEALPLADFDGIVEGLTALAARHRLHLAGGNLSRSPGPLMIDVTVLGTLKRRQALRRGGARAGDEIYVSGTIGAATAGLALLRARNSRQSAGASLQETASSRLSALASPSDANHPDDVLETDACRLINAYTRPEPRVRLGVWLGRNRAASACVDLSDGLADGVQRIAEASHVGILIDAAALPIDAAARTVLGPGDTDPTMAAIAGGDDYELLIAIRPSMRRYLKEAVHHGGVTLTRVGVCTAEGGIRMRVAGADLPLSGGYTHFGRVGTEPSGR